MGYLYLAGTWQVTTVYIRAGVCPIEAIPFDVGHEAHTSEGGDDGQ